MFPGKLWNLNVAIQILVLMDLVAVNLQTICWSAAHNASSYPRSIQYEFFYFVLKLNRKS